MKKLGKTQKEIVALVLAILVIGLSAVSLSHRGNVIREGNISYASSSFQLVNGLMEYQVDGYESLSGIDVSVYQGDIDWHEVDAFGIDFAMIRCGYRNATTGELNIDTKFEYNITQAINNGLDVGVYFYSTATTLDELNEEIDLVLGLVSQHNITYPIAYDMEPYGDNCRISNLTKEEKTLFAKTFCEAMEEHGYTAMIYGNANWLTNNLNFEEIQSYPIWYAAYQMNPTFEYPYMFWQYANNAIVPGINAKVDINIYPKQTN